MFIGLNYPRSETFNKSKSGFPSIHIFIQDTLGQKYFRYCLPNRKFLIDFYFFIFN